MFQAAVGKGESHGMEGEDKESFCKCLSKSIFVKLSEFE